MMSFTATIAISLLWQQQAANPMLSFLFMMLMMFGIMYFLMIRPQAKRLKAQQDYLKTLKKGDKIVTTGGIHGKVHKVEEATLLLEVDTNVVIRIEKSVISLELSQAINAAATTTTPVPAS